MVQPSLPNGVRELAEGGTLTSYCVKAAVRRSLQDIGFSVVRLPGPPRGKREVLLATKTTLSADTNADQSVPRAQLEELATVDSSNSN